MLIFPSVPLCLVQPMVLCSKLMSLQLLHCGCGIPESYQIGRSQPLADTVNKRRYCNFLPLQHIRGSFTPLNVWTLQYWFHLGRGCMYWYIRTLKCVFFLLSLSYFDLTNSAHSISQEVIKAISGKGDPLKNFFFFDVVDGKGVTEDISNHPAES